MNRGLLLFSLCLPLAWGCAPLGAFRGSIKPMKDIPPAISGGSWTLVWHDEFEGTELDESKWERVDCPRRKGFWDPKDAYLDGEGHLILRTRKEGDRYSSGAVRTRGKFEHAFGLWICRCKFHTQEGHWPAYWLFTGGVGKIGNGGRDGTEIDIMEKPWLHDQIQHALHWDGYGEHHQGKAQRVNREGLSQGFHLFSLEWNENEYVFYVDGVETWRTDLGGVSQVPSYLKLTEEIDTWGGDIAQADLPDYFTVDYVRVYDRLRE